jgi:cytochrome c-type biogenesis protein CcmE
LSKLIALVHSRIAVALFAVLFLGGSGMALAACGTNGDLRGTIASIDSVAASFVLTPQQPSGGASSLTVTVSPHTAFRGALHSFADLKTGMLVTVQGAGQSSAATLTADQIESDDGAQDQQDDHDGTQQRSDFSGTVGAINSSRSSFELKLADGSAKTVVTNAQTEFEGILHSFSDLKTGQQVSLTGNLQADGSISAARVEAENENDVEDANRVELTGTIAAVDATHSSFIIRLPNGAIKVVVTNAQTEFDGGFHGLGDLAKGMTVEVRGTTQPDGSLLASRVHREDGGDGSSGDGGTSSGSGGSDQSGHGTDDGGGHH